MVSVAPYFAYRLWSGWGDGVIYGDGDPDVRADEHPTAFVLTALSVVMIIVICLVISLGSSAGDVATLIAWLWKVWLAELSYPSKRTKQPFNLDRVRTHRGARLNRGPLFT